VRPPLSCQRGASAVEFALVAVAFSVVLLGITGFGHLMYTLEMLTDATRTGARMAAVCDLNDATVRAVIQARVPQLSLTSAQIALQYVPDGCNRSNCQAVRVSLTGVTYVPWFPLPAPISVPAFATSLPRESMESVNAAGEANPSCS
jgi:Flp pilus assembly protein TadG